MTQSEVTWESILEANSIINSVPHTKLLMLGDKNSGKSSFLQNAFQTNPTTDVLMSYNYYSHRDSDTNDLLMESDIYSISKDLPVNIELLVQEFSLDTLCCIFLNWEEPGSFLQTIEKWMMFLLNVVDIYLKRQFKIQDTQRTVFVETQVPDELSDYKKAYDKVEEAKLALKRIIQLFKESQSRDWTIQNDLSQLDIIPLNQGCLDVNIGVQVVFVLAKSDLCRTMVDKLELTSSKLEFMLQAIRKVALTIGAGVFSISSKSNLEVTLSEYLLHRLNRSLFSFSKDINAIDISHLVIPAGWDSLSKIKSISNASNLDESFLVRIAFEDGKHNVGISAKSHYKKQFPEKMEQDNEDVVCF